MTLPWWHPDEELLAEALKHLRDFARDLRQTLRPQPLPLRPEGAVEPETSQVATVTDLLEAAGTVVFLGEKLSARSLLSGLSKEPGLASLVSQAVRLLIEDSLEPRLGEMLRDVYDLRLTEEESRASMEETIVDALAERDRVELVLEGARCLLGLEPELDDETRAALLSFDETLSPELWRFLPLGTRRAARCAWAAPLFRERLWWWHRGCELPHKALEDVETAARVIHLFPKAREELDRLIQAERDIEKAAASLPVRGTQTGEPGRGKLISLREHILARLRAVTQPGAPRESDLLLVAERQRLYLAAAGDEEKPLYSTPEIVISSDGGTLFLDIQSPAEQAPGRLPLLEAADHPPVEGSPTEIGRFEFSLSIAHFSSEEAWITVFLEAGERRIRLPFDDES